MARGSVRFALLIQNTIICLLGIATSGLSASCIFYASVDPARSPVTFSGFSGTAAGAAINPLYTAAGEAAPPRCSHKIRVLPLSLCNELHAHSCFPARQHAAFLRTVQSSIPQSSIKLSIPAEEA